MVASKDKTVSPSRLNQGVLWFVSVCFVLERRRFLTLKNIQVEPHKPLKAVFDRKSAVLCTVEILELL